MIKVQLQTDVGEIFFDNVKVARLKLSDFLSVTVHNAVPVSNIPSNIASAVYKISPVEFCNRKFECTFWFKGEVLFLVSLSWLEGRTAALGWDVLEKDVLSDKNSLTRMLRKNLKANPRTLDDDQDRFCFAWGSVSAVPVRKAQYAKIDIRWNDNNEVN